MYYNDGDWYEGDFVNGFQEGFGKLYIKDGGYYVGEFKDGLFEGKGTLYNPLVRIVDDGFFYKGRPKIK